MVLFSLTFVRHGETLYNRKNIIQGQTDVPLSTLGERQAELAAQRLQNDRFTHIFSSDLSRAHETAKIISDANKVSRCEVTLDKRLRERKFGTAEGKSSKELLLSAKKAKKRYLDYTPAGAETVVQVQDRVKTFFRDICTLCINLSKAEDKTYTPAKIKRRHGGSLGRNSRNNKRLQISGRSQSFCGSGNIQNFINEINLSSDFDDNIESDLSGSFCHGDSYLSVQDCDSSEKALGDYQYREYFPSSSDDSNISSDLKSNGSSKSDVLSHSDTENFSTSSSSSINHNGIESDSTLSDHEGGESSLQHHNTNINSNALNVSCTFESPSPIRLVSSDYIPSYSPGSPICPNISLSPTAQRLSSISSISSGRNSSFDDADILPSTTADILVVSHGGYIKETMRYFVETLDCKIPGVKGHALKVCPNCSVSRFTVSLDEETGKPTLTCIFIHDKDHLVGLEAPDAKG